MKTVRVFPGKLKGVVEVPTSKSQTHRAILCAAMSEGVSTVRRVVPSEDIKATIEAAESFGAKVDCLGSLTEGKMVDLSILGNSPLRKAGETVDCRESGSTLRFSVPLALTTGETFRFTGRGKLPQRPMEEYYRIFDAQGIFYETEKGQLPLRVRGKLKAGLYKLKGDVSSQFVTGLLLALPNLEGSSEILMEGRLESGNYVDMTLEVQERFGVRVERKGYARFRVEPQSYKPANLEMEGDYSQGAFWMVGGLLGEGIALKGLRKDSRQGDRAAVSLLEAMGGRISAGEGDLAVGASSLEGIVMDASDCPDIVPIMAVAAAFAKGTTRIVNAGRLRYKESDRLMAISKELIKLGASVEETADGLVIAGRERLEGGARVWSHNDHRIAMALAIAATVCDKPVTIDGMEAIEKSYPEFIGDFRKLGGAMDERDLG